MITSWNNQCHRLCLMKRLQSKFMRWKNRWALRWRNYVRRTRGSCANCKGVRTRTEELYKESMITWVKDSNQQVCSHKGNSQQLRNRKTIWHCLLMNSIVGMPDFHRWVEHHTLFHRIQTYSQISSLWTMGTQHWTSLSTNPHNHLSSSHPGHNLRHLQLNSDKTWWKIILLDVKASIKGPKWGSWWRVKDRSRSRKVSIWGHRQPVFHPSQCW